MVDVLRVEVLGPLTVVGLDGRVIGLGSALRRLLARLVVDAGAVVTTDHLAELLDVGGGGLRTAVSRLRQSAGAGMVVTAPTGYALGAVDVDAVRFAGLVRDARAAEGATAVRVLESALSLWRGVAYGEFAEEEWARPEAVRLNELRAAAVEDLAEALVVLGRWVEAIARLEQHISGFPLRDRPRGLLMRALAGDGRQVEALRVFHDYRSWLGEEVGTEPSVELRELEARIATGWHDRVDRSDTVQLASSGGAGAAAALDREPARRSSLPTFGDSFVGRTQELARLTRDLTQFRVVTVFGVGGMGKTRLAIEAAARSFGFTDGAWLVELGAVGDDAGVDLAVASTLGLRPEAGVSCAEQVVAWCRQRVALLILDNCEHVVDGVARLVSAIVRSDSVARVLATSREPIVVAGEHLVSLGPLSVPSGDDPDAESDALRLLLDRSGAQIGDFDAVADRAALAQICARLDGMPLALELAATRLRALTPSALAARLDERFRLLTGGRRTATERHKTLRAAVGWSYDLLTARQRRLFERLAVFTGPFGLDDVAAIDAASEEPARSDVAVVEVLAELIDRSLVVASNTDPPYRMLETIRAFGVERLQLAGAIDDVRGAHARWFHRKALTARGDACGPAERSMYHAVWSQMPDYRAAAAWALDGGNVDVGVGIPVAFFEAFYLRAPTDLLAWAAPLVAPVRTTAATPRTRAGALWLWAAWAQFLVGDLDAAADALRDAIAVDPTNAVCHCQLAVNAMLAGDADHVLEPALTAARLVGDDDAVARSYTYVALGNGLVQLGRIADARPVASAFRDLGRRLDWPSALGYALHLSGRVEVDEHPDRALAHFDDALRIAQDVDAPGLAIVVRREMIPLLIDRPGDAVIATLSDVLHLCRNRHDLGNGGAALAYAVMVLARRGDPETAAVLTGKVGSPLLSSADRTTYDDVVTDLRHRLGGRFDELAGRGTERTILELLDLAIAAVDIATTRS